MGKRYGGKWALRTALRELEEEAGVRATDWQTMGDILTTPGFCDEIFPLVLARRLLDDPAEAAAWAARNYELAARHFSFTVLRRHLEDLLLDCFGVDPPG